MQSTAEHETNIVTDINYIGLRFSVFRSVDVTFVVDSDLHVKESYICDCLQLYTSSRTLRSASDTLGLQIPHTRLSTVGFRAFSVFGPSAWNDLSLPLRQKPTLHSVK